jgi:ABC-type maltose transport system permease subunit
MMLPYQVVMIPQFILFLVFIFFQRYLVEGIGTTGLKGCWEGGAK